jgi:hypothetical protein
MRKKCILFVHKDEEKVPFHSFIDEEQEEQEGRSIRSSMKKK